MSEETQNTPKTPNFEGEKMKMPENSTVEHVEEEHKSEATGPIILILGVLLLLILGGLFYWYTTMNATPEPVVPEPTPIERPTPEENNEPESTTAEARTDTMQTVSTSDEIAAIEADIEATDLEALDAELEAIEAELNAAF